MPTAIVMAAAAGLAWRETGSTAAQHWLPYAIVAALTLVTVLLAGTAARRLPTAHVLAIGLLVAAAAWAAVSLAWAPQPSLGKDEVLLRLFYVVALAVPLLTIRSIDDRLAALGVIAGTLAIVAIGTAVKLWQADEAGALYREGRLNFPIAYVNANASFFLIGFWPAVVIAARRAGRVLVRVPALAAATVCLALAVGAQSKGGVLGFVASAIVVLALSPARLRLFVPAAVATGLVGLGFLSLTGPFRAEGGEVPAAVNAAGRTACILGAVSIGVALVYVLIDRQIRLSEPARRLVGRVAAVAVAVGIVAGGAGFVSAVGDPQEWASKQWDEFKVYSSDRGEATHLTALGSNRYDFWRVALEEFREHPVSGVGTRGFYVEYLIERESVETPTRGHSLPLDVLMEEGAVGFILVAAPIGLLIALALRRARRRKAPAVAALATATLVLVHASVDWTWTVPAIGVPFFLLLGAAIADDDRPRLPRRFANPAAAVVALATLLLLFPPWISARLTDNVQAAGGGPDAASDLKWARRLDPLSLVPDFVEARYAGSVEEAARALERAVEKEPRYGVGHYHLGVLYLRLGRYDDARSSLQRAAELIPGDATVQLALAQTRRR